MSMKPIIFLALFSIMVLFFQNCSGSGSSVLKTDLKSPTDQPSNEPQEPVKEVQEHQKVLSIPLEYTSLVTVFQSLGKNLVIDDLIIEFVEQTPDMEFSYMPGKCEKLPNKTPKISIALWAKDRANDNGVGRFLFYHLMGHCVLGRPDNDLLVRNGFEPNQWAAASIMNPRIESVMLDWWWVDGRKTVDTYFPTYYRELFENTPWDPYLVEN